MELTKIRNVNEKREKEFNKLGIFDTADLMRYFPRAYLDLRERQLLKYAYHNDVVLTAGKVLNIPVTRYYRRGGLVKVVHRCCEPLTPLKRDRGSVHPKFAGGKCHLLLRRR